MATQSARTSGERVRALVAGREHWIVCGIAAVVLVIHSLQYNFVTDDAYISFVFSRNFAEHGQLAFNLGDPVEGYTNFLWTVILGALMVVGIPPELSSRVLGTACAIGTLVVVTRVMLRVLRPADGTRTSSLWAGMPALVLACSSGFACWSSGGLETQLFTFLVTLALDGFVAARTDKRALRRVAIALALASMTRPEGPMIAAIFGLLWLGGGALARIVGRVRMPPEPPVAAETVRGRWRYRDELVAAAWFLGLWAPWFAWRWWYYGYPFPNTYYVKAAGPWSHPSYAGKMLDNGLYYVWVWITQTRLLYGLPLVIIGLAWSRPRAPRFALTTACGVIAAVYLPYAISVGGDFMGLHRFIMPVFVCVAIPLALGMERVTHVLAMLVPARLAPKLGPVIGGLVALVVVGGFARTQVALTDQALHPKSLANDRGIDSPAFLIVYTADRAAIGKAMAPCFREDDFSIVGGAGAQPYYGRMRGIDVFGLVSERIAHEEPRSHARAGHTKWGSPDLLAAHDPTFVFSCYDIHKTPAKPRLACAPYWLARGFEHVTMHVPGMRERGAYYTFLAKQSRAFQCPGRVP